MNAVAVALLLIAAAAAASVPIVRWWSDRRLSMKELPPLVVPLRARGDGVFEAPIIPARPASRFEPPRVERFEQVVSVEPVANADEVAGVDEPAPYEPDESQLTSNETVRFKRPVEEPVQLLPGRLEVLAGDTHQHEIRFVRIPGEPMQMILGRDSGPSAQYVALRSNTVSRQHARLAFSNGHWAVANLSRTNPVVVNDEELSHIDGSRDLTDGDRLELGEVVLRFRER